MYLIPTISLSRSLMRLRPRRFWTLDVSNPLSRTLDELI